MKNTVQTVKNTAQTAKNTVNTVKKIDEVLENIKTVALIGHIRPDGDCVGSCLGLYNYLKDNFSHLQVQIYLELIPEAFNFLRGAEIINHDFSSLPAPDLCIALDGSDKERFGKTYPVFEKAGRTVCIDHHITNDGFADINHIIPDASATCEVLYELMDDEKISKETAECLYMGIIHDTGIFKHSNTTRRTMEVAGRLMDKGIPYSQIIDDSFYAKSMVQNKVLGLVLTNCELLLDGRLIFGFLKKEDIRKLGADTRDVDGVIDSLRTTKGAECAAFVYELEPNEIKISLRSSSDLMVSDVAADFGGGGHRKAAGASFNGSIEEVKNALMKAIEPRLNKVKLNKTRESSDKVKLNKTRESSDKQEK